MIARLLDSRTVYTTVHPTVHSFASGSLRRIGRAFIALLAFISLVDAAAQTVTAPPQPINTPPPPSPWTQIRVPAPRALLLPPGNGGKAPLVQTPTTAAPPTAGEAAVPPGQLTLSVFLRQTLGQKPDRAYVLMPSVGTQMPVLIGDLGRVRLEDPEPLVRQVLHNLGLEMVESSGVWVIQPRSTEERGDGEAQIWIYSPRNRPISSLAVYFQNFPRLAFNYSSAIPSRTMEPARLDEYGGGMVQPSMGAGGWPGGDISGIGGTILSGQASGGGAVMSAMVTPAAAALPSFNTMPFSSQATTLSDPSFLVVRGLPRDISDFQAFMEKVDVPVPEVQLRMYVLEVRDMENRQSAVQLLLNLLDGRINLNAGSTPTESNRLFLGTKDASMAVSRLTSDSRVRLVSSPTLRAADGSTASVTIGTDTPTLGSIVTFSGTMQQSVTYQSAGVLLNVSPHILNDSIRLMIWQELSSFAKTETGLSATPTKLRRAFRTDVIARNGEVLMLGGLSEAARTENRARGLFGLGSSSMENEHSEIVVLLQVIRI